MLQTIRQHAQGWVASIIAIILCLAFALWGIEYYLGGDRNDQVAATVNGTQISNLQWEMTYRRLQQSSPLGQQANFDTTIEQQLKNQALADLIEQTILSQAAIKSGYIVTQPQVAATVTHIPEFQVNGQFSKALFLQVAQTLFGSEQQFLQDIQEKSVILQAQLGVTGSEFALPNDVDRLLTLAQESRSVQYAKIPVGNFLGATQISDQQIAEYYKTHSSEFMTKEVISLQYIILSANEMSDAKLTELTNLIYTHPDTLTTAAEALNLRIETTPLFGREGASEPAFLTNPKIRAIAFSPNVLDERNNSDVISLDSEHAIVIRVLEHKPAVVKPLPEVRNEIENRLKRSAAQKAAQASAEQIAKSLNAGKSLSDIAAQYKLTWQAVSGITRQNLQGLPSEAVFKASAQSTGVATAANGDIFVVVLGRVIPGNPGVDAQERKKAQATLASEIGQFEYFLYTKHYTDNAKVKR